MHPYQPHYPPKATPGTPNFGSSHSQHAPSDAQVPGKSDQEPGFWSSPPPAAAVQASNPTYAQTPASVAAATLYVSPPGGYQSGPPVTDETRFHAHNCLVPGEVIIGRVHETPKDCSTGTLRTTLCTTNLRVIINTHMTVLFCVQQDSHESIFYENIYDVKVGKATTIGHSGGEAAIGWAGLVLLLGAVSTAVHHIISSMFTPGSVVTIFYALHKSLPDQKRAILPSFDTRIIESRLETAECFEVIQAILTHRDTCLLSKSGTRQ